MDVQLQEDGGIPVVPFLEACKSVLTIFGKNISFLSSLQVNSEINLASHGGRTRQQGRISHNVYVSICRQIKPNRIHSGQIGCFGKHQGKCCPSKYLIWK